MKKIIVKCETYSEWKRVLDKAFSKGYRWNGGEKGYMKDFFEEYDPEYIGLNIKDDHKLSYGGDDCDYEEKLSAKEYLGEEKREFKVGDRGNDCWSARDLMQRLDYDRWENFEKVIKKGMTACENSKQPISYHFREVTKSIDVPKGGTIQTMLKKATNLIKGLTQPLQNYVRLGWVEIEDDEYVVTEEGQQAFMTFSFGLTEHATMKGYASDEVARLEKEEKKKK